MMWGEIKKWAKSIGYDTIKDKDDNKYYWAKLDSSDPSSSGVAVSVSKLAKAIYNHHSDYKWVEHQEEYQNNKEEKNFSTNNYGL